MNKFKKILFSFTFILGCALSACGTSVASSSSEKDYITPRFDSMVIADGEAVEKIINDKTVNKEALFSYRDKKTDGEDENDNDNVNTNNDKKDDNGDDLHKPNSNHGGKKANDLPEDDMPTSSTEDDIEDVVVPNISIDPVTDTSMTYASINEDVYLTIVLVNPESFPILRFTLNGVVYQSYQFENGSTSTLLILKVNSGSEPGIHEYSLDEMKYVDGDNQIKDVIIGDNHTAKLCVAYNRLPEVNITNRSSDMDKYSFSLSVTDPESLVDFENKDCKLYLFDGENVLLEKALEKGVNSINFENLILGKEYQFAVFASFDDLSGNGKIAHTLYKESISTLSSSLCKLSYVDATFNSVSFDYEIINENLGITIDSVYLLDSQDQPLAMMDETKSFIDLYSDTDYKLRLYFSFALGENNYTYYDSVTFHTKTLTAPSVSVLYDVLDGSVNYSVNVDDDNGIATINSVKLFNVDGDFIDVADISNGIKNLSFNGLQRNASYYLKVSFSYDLNDGQGERTEEKVVTFSTNKAVPTVEIQQYAATTNGASFYILATDPNSVGQIGSIRVLLASNRSLVREYKDFTIREVDNLLSNTKYIIEVGYIFDMNDGKGSQVVKYEGEVTTAKSAPHVEFASNASEDAVELRYSIMDIDKALTLKSYELYKDGILVDTITDPKSVETFTGLLSDTEYHAVLNYEQDLNDFNNASQLSVTKSFRTLIKSKPVVSVSASNVNYDSFDYQINLNDPNGICNIEKIELIVSGNTIEEFTELSGHVSDLFSNNSYRIKVTFSYDLNNGNGKVSDSVVYDFKTLKHDDVSVEFDSTKMIANETSMDFDLIVNDPNGFVTINKLEVRKGNEVIQSTEDITVRTFEGLEESTFYSIWVYYSFDMNDGRGVQTDCKSIQFGTSGAQIFITDFKVINNSTPSVGDWVEIKVQLNNPENIDVQSLTIDGKECVVRSGNLNMSGEVIVAFVPDTLGGLTNVTINGYTYLSSDILLKDTLVSPYQKSIVVLGDISVKDFFSVSDTHYVNFTSSSPSIRILELDNPTGYTIRKIFNGDNELQNFVKLDDSHIMIYTNESTCSITGIEYGIDGDDSSFKKKEFNTISCLSIRYKNVIEINTEEDLANAVSNDSPYYYGEGYVYVLNNDLDMSNYKWTTLVSPNSAFLGNGHTIKGLTMVINNETTSQGYSFLEGFALVCDLKLTDVYYSIHTTCHVNVSGIMGSGNCSYNQTMVNCSIGGKIIVELSDYTGTGSCRINGIGMNMYNLSGCYVEDLQIESNCSVDYSFTTNGYIYSGVNVGLCYVLGNTFFKNTETGVISNATKNHERMILESDFYDTEFVIKTNTEEYGDITVNGMYLESINISREGYIFAIYDNENFTGSPISLPYTNKELSTLYVKWTRIYQAPDYFTYREDYVTINNVQVKVYSICGVTEQYGGTLKNIDNIVIGGYLYGCPVVGMDYNESCFYYYDEDHGYTTSCFTNKTVYVMNTIGICTENWYNQGYLYEAKEIYFDGFQKNYNSDLPNYDSERNIYATKEAIDVALANGYITKKQAQYIKTVDQSVLDGQKNFYNSSAPIISVEGVSADGFYDGIHIDAGELKATKEIICGCEVIRYGDYSCYVTGKNKDVVYYDINTIVEDENYKYLIHNNGDVVLLNCINNNLTNADLTNIDYVIKEIAPGAFYEMNIKYIKFNDEIEKIGYQAFYNTKIKSLELPKNLKEIGVCAFAGCNQLSTITMNDELEIIGDGSFENNYYCKVLHWSSSLKEIGSYAFSWDYYLGDFVVLPNSLEIIGYNAFYGINSTKFVIPSSVKKISSYAFSGLCFVNEGADTSLWDENWNKESQFDAIFKYKDHVIENGFDYVIYNENDVMILKITSDAENIDFTYFDDHALSVKMIYDYAFQSVSLNKKYIYLPNSVEKIGSNVFSGLNRCCVVFGENIKEISTIQSNLVDTNTYFCVLENAPKTLDVDVANSIIFGFNGFESNEKYDYAVVNHNSAYIIKANGFDYVDDHYTIIVDGYAVVGICSHIHSNSYVNLNSSQLWIPESVTFIAYQAFSEIRYVVICIPSSVVNVGGCICYYDASFICDFASVPSTWSSNWNPNGLSVTWLQA